ncbi:MAG: FAD-binding oxidoreductase [Bdellovibrionales bacterium]|nr:FAD-binding oxidoreductase [Bdellovibrionales bacterium]
MQKNKDNFFKDIKSCLTEKQILTSVDDIKIYSSDRSKDFIGNGSLVLFPHSTKEVQSIISLAKKYNIGLLSSGGRTGLSAGATATKNEVIVSLEKMNKIFKFIPEEQSLFCQAGVITQHIQEEALKHNLIYPINFAATGSSHIGGNVATNAGGIKVLRYGNTRDWITSLTVVTGNAEILHLKNALVKDATGYDLSQLFIGSEGSLGIITEVTVKLTSPAKKNISLLLASSSISNLLKVYFQYKNKTNLIAFEFFTKEALKYSLDHSKKNCPISCEHDFYVTAEVDVQNKTDEEVLMQILEESLEKELIVDGTISQNKDQDKLIWDLRENISESIHYRSPHKNDVAVRLSNLEEFIKDLQLLISLLPKNYELIYFGHIGDGNLHINLLKPDGESDESFMAAYKKLDLQIFDLIKKYKGSVSAEHGVGLVKKDYLQFSKTEEEINIMKQIKKIFDPNNILNPGKIF